MNSLRYKELLTVVIAKATYNDIKTINPDYEYYIGVDGYIRSLRNIKQDAKAKDLIAIVYFESADFHLDDQIDMCGLNYALSGVSFVNIVNLLPIQDCTDVDDVCPATKLRLVVEFYLEEFDYSNPDDIRANEHFMEEERELHNVTIIGYLDSDFNLHTI